MYITSTKFESEILKIEEKYENTYMVKFEFFKSRETSNLPRNIRKKNNG